MSLRINKICLGDHDVCVHLATRSKTITGKVLGKEEFFNPEGRGRLTKIYIDRKVHEFNGQNFEGEGFVCSADGAISTILTVICSD